MWAVKEVSRRTGVSVRTLHYYDAIGLLKPARVTEAGYRLYDEAALCRLQSILLFRELRFPLKDIKAMLDSPDFCQEEAIAQQIKLLEMQHRHIGELIAFAREVQAKGARAMGFEAFDTSEMERYKAEVRAKWGDSQAYRAYAQRESCLGERGMAKAAEGMMALFAELGALKHLPPEDAAVGQKVAALQAYISENFYPCTDEILKGLGELYVGDERFKRNIDRVGGEGTAAFAGRAILAHCGARDM